MHGLSRLFITALVLAGWCTWARAAQDYVTEQELEELQAALRNLDAELDAAKSREEVPAEYTQRIDEIRENTIYLKVKMRKHREQGGEGTGITEDELGALKSDIASLRSDLGRLRSDRVEGTLTLPVGTRFSVRLQDSLSTRLSQPGDKFEATTIEPVLHRGELAIPAGSVVYGAVEVVDRPEGRTDRKGRLVLAFDRIEIRGKTYDLAATVVGASEDLETGLGDEKTKMGVGAGIGTILGAVLGGKKGAVVGAVLGGAGAILATEGKDVELPPGAVLELRLDRDLAVSSPAT